MASDLLKLSPFPVVDLTAIDTPRDGLWQATPATCRRHFAKSPQCRDHYASLSARHATPNSVVQCPFGFSSVPFQEGDLKFAITSVIPFPRVGGEQEKRMAKAHPEAKVSVESVISASEVIMAARRQREAVIDEGIRRRSMALHEIRKLNRNIKLNAERLCQSESPHDPDSARPELVRILKSAEVMSQQFEVLEILANESLATLPLKGVIEIYRIVDKCVRINRPPDSPHRLGLAAPFGFDVRIAASDKTFPIIPMVLIENALRYAVPNTEVHVTLDRTKSGCVLQVMNIAPGDKPLTDEIFQKGKRATTKGEGSGNGLYVAQLVAHQHGARIKVSSTVVGKGQLRNVFRVEFDEAKKS